MVGADLVPRWLNARWFAERGVEGNALEAPRAANILRAALRASVEQTSLPALLRYEDRNAMAHSVESRVPFLTPELVTFCLSLPEEYLIAPDGTSKAVFRKAMQGVVPAAVLGRRDKIGFETPELNWLRELEAWVTQTISGAAVERMPGLDGPMMRADWVGILDGKRTFDSRVWRWVNLLRWAELMDVYAER
jgi:asparagine synthase (glutamine-hydrolysing)